jgi:leucyl/phenylalanyl-tRNA--protein transferase
VGGLYGVALGGVFFGESMFSRATDASKVALVALVSKLRAWGFALIDCQIPSAHLTSLGAEEIPRNVFLTELERALKLSGHPGRWQMEIATQDLSDTGSLP